MTLRWRLMRVGQKRRWLPVVLHSVPGKRNHSQVCRPVSRHCARKPKRRCGAGAHGQHLRPAQSTKGPSIFVRPELMDMLINRKCCRRCRSAQVTNSLARLRKPRYAGAQYRGCASRTHQEFNTDLLFHREAIMTTVATVPTTDMQHMPPVAIARNANMGRDGRLPRSHARPLLDRAGSLTA
jgi:hypothetical protein